MIIFIKWSKNIQQKLFSDKNKVKERNKIYIFAYTGKFVEEKSSLFCDVRMHQYAKSILNKFTIFFPLTTPISQVD